jgi:hypothetical protein
MSVRKSDRSWTGWKYRLGMIVYSLTQINTRLIK